MIIRFSPAEYGWSMPSERLKPVVTTVLGGLLALQTLLVTERLIDSEPAAAQDESASLIAAASPQPVSEKTSVKGLRVEQAPSSPPLSALPPEMLNPPCVETRIPWLPESVARWHPYVEQSAKIFGLPPELMDILMFIESVGNPAAVSPKDARGLIQIWKPTGDSLIQQLGLPPVDIADPATNIYLSGRYIRNQIDNGSVDVSQGFTTETIRQIAIAYNGGPGRLSNYQHAGGYAVLPMETQRYSDRVALAWDERFMPTSQVYNEYMSMSGPRDLQAAGANLGTPPC